MKQSDLKKISEKCAKKIKNASKSNQYFEYPFQHIIIDNFLDNILIDKVDANFPQLDDSQWQNSNDEGIEIKSRTNWTSEFDIPDGIVDTIRVFNSSPILKAIGEKLNIPKLIPDPYYTGGGLNITQKNGLLDIHVDGNYHDATGLNRRVNLLLYLNKKWEPDWGGEFGIYENDGEVLHKAVPPIFNRCIIFDTHDKSYHGLPNPLNFPDNQIRRSIILYYYTLAPRPNEDVIVKEPHSALWKSKNFTDKKGRRKREFT
jgi:Rps23 Pro-64 3,4-dihydroxylase Tpa1-like proline 4-hydroxylase